MRSVSKGKLCAFTLLAVLSAQGVLAAPRDGSRSWLIRIRHFLVAILGDQLGGPPP
jgi:hypothetical protein